MVPFRVQAAVLLFLLFGCASASSNLARLQAECAAAPGISTAASLIPAPGVGAGISLTLAAICANPQMVANDEAAIASAIATLTEKKP